MMYSKVILWLSVSTTCFIYVQLNIESQRGSVKHTDEENDAPTKKTFLPEQDFQSKKLLSTESPPESRMRKMYFKGNDVQNQSTSVSRKVFHDKMQRLNTSKQQSVSTKASLNKAFPVGHDTDISADNEIPVTRNNSNCTVISEDEEENIKAKQFPSKRILSHIIRDKNHATICENDVESIARPEENTPTDNIDTKDDPSVSIESNITLVLSHLRSHMTCESVFGYTTTFQVVSKSDKITAIHNAYNKCNFMSGLDADFVLPLIHKTLGVVFQNVYCLIGSRIPLLSRGRKMVEVWKLSITKECYDLYINIKHKYYLHFINHILKNENCQTKLLPPSDYLKHINVQDNSQTCTLPLIQACSVNYTETKGRVLKRPPCWACSWVHDQQICVNSSQTYYLLQSPTYVFQESKCAEPIPDVQFCYGAVCNTGELGERNRCFNPIEKVAGVITNVWIRFKYERNHTDQSLDELIKETSKEFTNKLNTDEAHMNIKMFMTETSAKEVNGRMCAVTNVIHYTKQYVEFEKTQIFITLLQNKSNGTQTQMGSNLTISTKTLKCQEEKRITIVDGQFDNDEITVTESQMIYISFAVCFAVVLILSVIGVIKKHCLNQSEPV